MTAGREGAAILDAEARFLHLPTPSYEPDDRGIRRGTAPTLSAFGGGLVAASAAGAWLRITRLASESGDPEVVHEVLGLRFGPGPALLILALFALAATAGWHRDSVLVRRAAHTVTLTTAAMAGAGLLLLQSRIGAATDAAIADAHFFDLNAGAGWGAWAALIGAAALVLASISAALAEPSVHGAPGDDR